MRYFMKSYMLIIVTAAFVLTCSSKSSMGHVDVTKPYCTFSLSFNTKSYPWLMGKKYPQIALWVKDEKSGKSQTIFVTGKAAKNKWFGAEVRPSSLPVWYGFNKNLKKFLDATTGATPSGKVFTIKWQIPKNLESKKVTIYMEANVSFDYNEYYKKGLKADNPAFSDVNGQPSIIWKADLTFNNQKQSVHPEIAGHGHVLGKDHSIKKDLSKITTAKNLFNYVNCKYSPGKSN